MGRIAGVVEESEAARRIRLGRLWGVPVVATPWAWLSPVLVAGLALLLTLPRRGLSPRQRLTATLAITSAGQLANLVHAAGHVAAGRLVGAPMDELLLTGTRIVNIYHGDQAAYPPPVHLARALGGPVANLLLAALTAWLVRQTGDDRFGVARPLVAVSLVAGLGALLPLPSVDGEVIWRELTRSRRPEEPPPQVCPWGGRTGRWRTAWPAATTCMTRPTLSSDSACGRGLTPAAASGTERARWPHSWLGLVAEQQGVDERAATLLAAELAACRTHGDQ